MKTAMETCRRRYTGVFRDVEQGFKSLHLRQIKPSRFYGLGGFLLHIFEFPGNSELIAISYLQSFCSVGNSKATLQSKMAMKLAIEKMANSQLFSLPPAPQL